jgi:hypothetical protein
MRFRRRNFALAIKPEVATVIDRIARRRGGDDEPGELLAEDKYVRDSSIETLAPRVLRESAKKRIREH